MTLGTNIVEGNVISIGVHDVALEKYFGNIQVINVGGLSDDNSGLSTAAPPGVGVNLVVLDGNVVSLVHPNTRVRAMMNFAMMNVDVVARPGHNTTTLELLGLDQSVCKSFLQGEVRNMWL